VPEAPVNIPASQSTASGSKDDAASQNKKPKQSKQAAPVQSADEFLAILERDIMAKKTSS
jgi:hypothetical protein